MSKIDEAVDRIKRLECPTGEVEKSVALILEDYDVASGDDVRIGRDKRHDRDEAEAYRVDIAGQRQSLVVLAKSMDDDYVAKVVDVYTN